MDFTFTLPESSLEVQPVVRVDRAVAKRTFVLLFDLERDFGDTPAGASLSWSDSLDSLFRYIPATAAPGIVHLAGFVLPTRVERLAIRVRAWNTSEPSPVEDMALTTALCEEPAVIFAERT